MQRPAMNEPSDLWEPDGMLRDVYVHDVDRDAWEAFFGVTKRHRHEYVVEGKVGSLPSLEQILEENELSRTLRIWVGTAQINCHFFGSDEIELDIDPRQVCDEHTHAQILDFLEDIAAATNRRVAITAENSPAIEYLVYEPASKTWLVVADPNDA